MPTKRRALEKLKKDELLAAGLPRPRTSTLSRVKALSRVKLRSETDVELSFVPEFLAILGYRFPPDLRNVPALDSTDYYVGSRKKTAIYPDHLILADSRIAFALEVKSPSLHLEKAHIGQLLSYALHPDVEARLSVLTNGRRTLVIQSHRREIILDVNQKELPLKLPDLQLILGRASFANMVADLIIEKKLGSGAFGTVYRAWNLAIRRHEALKIYHPSALMSDRSRKRLANGLRAQGQLHHDSIASIYRVDSEGAEVTVAMQYSPGIPFDQWLRRNPSITERIRILARIARAVHFAHEHGIVHRDLKPSNVMIEREGKSWKPLIVDFDTAVLVQATSLTSASESIGTLGFMAPEMLTPTGRTKKRSHRVDIYSLGALAFFAFFGEAPDLGATWLRLDSLVKQVRGLKESQARRLALIILRAIDREPGVRPESANLFAQDLEESISKASAVDPPDEEVIVDSLFKEIDRGLMAKPIPGFLPERLEEANNQLAFVSKILGVGEGAILYDFDYRELMAGFSFASHRQFNAFLKYGVVGRLRNIFGDALSVDPPNPHEDGGVTLQWRFSDMLRKDATLLARDVIDKLRTFYLVLDEAGTHDAGATVNTPGLDIRPVPLVAGDKTSPEIFLSYAWDDETSEGKIRGEVVDRLEAALAEDGFTPVRDRHQMKPGDLFSSFLRRLTGSDLVVAVISEKYLRSPYCMYEIYKVWQRCQTDNGLMARSLVPIVLPEVKIGNLRERQPYLKHWADEAKSLKKLIRDPELSPGRESWDQVRLVQEFAHHVDDILVFLQDVLMPRKLETLLENGVQAVREAVRTRIRERRVLGLPT